MSLSEIFSLVSSTAVVITLVFLFFQMQQANRNQRSLIQQARSARTVALIMSQTEPYLSDLIARTGRGETNLEDKDLIAFISHHAAVFWNYEDSFLQHQAGTLDAASWQTDLTTLSALLARPAYRVAWQVNREYSTGDYRRLVDNLIRETKSVKQSSLAAMWNARMADELANAA
jgi:hypothetical protein